MSHQAIVTKIFHVSSLPGQTCGAANTHVVGSEEVLKTLSYTQCNATQYCTLGHVYNAEIMPVSSGCLGPYNL